MTTPQEIRLDTPRGAFAGLAWPVPGGPRVLALHGWLDNAASFMPLAAHFEGLDFIALDLAGHGHSGHRAPPAQYYFTDNLFDLDSALDALDWEACHLIGHSMGGAIASLFALAAPERVLSITLLDALGPPSEEPAGTAGRLRRSLESLRRPPRRLKVYASLDAMAAARIANADDLDAGAARLICERAARPVAGGFEWRTDPALHWVSPVLMTEQQVLACLGQLRAPVLTLTALPHARWFSAEQIRRRAAAIPHGVHDTVEGNHHFHMDRAANIGERILRFILDHRPTAEEPT